MHATGPKTELSQELYRRLSSGGEDVTPASYKEKGGEMRKLPDGTRVGIREESSSTPGKQTLDVHYGDGTKAKVHVETPNGK